MGVPVVWATNEPGTIARHYWDQGMVEALLANRLWAVPGMPEFDHYEVAPPGSLYFDAAPAGAVLVVPARHNVKHVAWLNEILAGLSDWCVLFLTGDEACEFPLHELSGPPTFDLYVSHVDEDAPEPAVSSLTVLGSGWPPWFAETLPDEPPEKWLAWSFAGQVTHARRVEMRDALEPFAVENEAQARKKPRGGFLVATTEFASGLPASEYVRLVAATRVVPCPSGPESPDSFRLYEALEAGCVPLADAATPHGPEPRHWTSVFGEAPPFPEVHDWASAPELLTEVGGWWPSWGNRVHAWWQNRKRDLAYSFRRRIPQPPWAPPAEITPIIVTSPTRLHPETRDLDETLQSVRAQLPDSDVIVVCDGVRPEQEYLRADYEEYVRRVCWKANRTGKVLPVVLPAWGHQANALRAALDYVRTPLILFVEHDTPVYEEIPWLDLAAEIHAGRANVIRLAHESSVLPEHAHLMLATDPQAHMSIDEYGSAPPMLPTVQWSQRPHLAPTFWYRQILDLYFPVESRTMIEDVLHGVVQHDYAAHSRAGWEWWRIWLFAPDGDMKRSWHLDTRGDEPKYEMWT